ncbi:histidine kinase [Actinosynnema sp. NPDC051121]
MYCVVRWLRRTGALLPGSLRPPDHAAARLRHGIEQTLHDGAVAEISTLALELGMVAALTDDPVVQVRVAAAQHRVQRVVDELRQVGSAIYPPVLASAGLGPGLRAVAERRGLDLLLDLPCRELDAVTGARAGLLIADYFATLPAGSVVRVRVRGRRIIRVSITDRQRGGTPPHEHRAVLRCG